MCKAPVPPTSNSQWYWTDNRTRATLGQPSHPMRHTLSLHTATYARKKPAEAHAQLKEEVLLHMKNKVFDIRPPSTLGTERHGCPGAPPPYRLKPV